MRLIDADALEFSYFAHIENYSIHPEYAEDYKRGFNNAVMRDIGIIYNAPTIEERPKGKWEYTDGRWGLGNWRCSKCGGYTNKDTHYCPNCSADMRGEE